MRQQAGIIGRRLVLAAAISVLWIAPTFAAVPGLAPAPTQTLLAPVSQAASTDTPSPSSAQPGQMRVQLASTEPLDDGTLPDALKPGEFEWTLAADVRSDSALLIVVSLLDQRAYVYRDGEQIAVSTVSTGKPGKETPTGVFPILQKQKMHHSSLYDDAPMPFMQRLTWDGVALHAGRIPGHPASHGCVRLPKAFAEKLYGITRFGNAVVVSEDGSVEALARAGLDEQLALLVGSASSIHRIVSLVQVDTPATLHSAGDSTMESLTRAGTVSSIVSQR